MRLSVKSLGTWALSGATLLEVGKSWASSLPPRFRTSSSLLCRKFKTEPPRGSRRPSVVSSITLPTSERSNLRLVRISVLPQHALVVLPAIKHADDRYHIAIDVERDHRTLPVVGDPQSGTHVVALGAAMRKRAKALAVVDDRVGVSRGDIGRGQFRDVPIVFEKLLYSASGAKTTRKFTSARSARQPGVHARDRP